MPQEDTNVHNGQVVSEAWALGKTLYALKAEQIEKAIPQAKALGLDSQAIELLELLLAITKMYDQFGLREAQDKREAFFEGVLDEKKS